MDTDLCRKFSIEFPLFAFSHCRDVVAEVTKAGGFGVLGAVGQTVESLEEDLNWMDLNVGGLPYGVDLLIPNNIEDKEGILTEQLLEDRIPRSQRRYVEVLLENHGIDTTDLWSGKYGGNNYSKNLLENGANELLDIALGHNISLFVNALGVPPESTIERCRARGVAVGALTGTKEHALKHAEAGVDILVVSGTEAGGHCGEISTLVVVPEVIEAIKDYQGMHVLAAGGIATGGQMAACMAMGAAGVWCGSVWLTTTEAETTPTVKAKMLSASSRDTVRSTSRTGKPTRQLKSAWTEAWKSPTKPPRTGQNRSSGGKWR
jgi:NAD(P)H-dependent flavin oxidoreductase YrpB (nitropropane dioxygenase family)